MNPRTDVSGASDIPIVAINRLDLVFAPRPWPFAQERRAEIDKHFASLKRQKPALYNGRMLIMHRHAIVSDTLNGAYLETDYASYVAWRDWGFPDEAVRNCFALGALRGSDGAFLLGVMGEHTMNAGQIYFPGGTPDPSDISDGKVDLEGSVRREVEEETGLGSDHFTIEPHWRAALAGPRLGLIKVMQAREPADDLRERILAYIRAETEPELADIRIARGPDDLDPLMPPFVHVYLRHMWACGTVL